MTTTRMALRRAVLGGIALFGVGIGAAQGDTGDGAATLDPRLTVGLDRSGAIGTFKVDAPIDTANPFFQSF